ncbi:kelch-like protein diablo [Dendronephthya gigantea]|uniref:kelch-like protein diablo n=1 Tax=Dendronephthya gigantea TaxID=151771 RepID=UPI00106A6FD1|nr:kelch-like protein diablo [Dendronephthya gigantea]
MTKTLADMEQRMANIEKNNVTIGTKITNLEKNVATVANIVKNREDIKADMEGKLEAVNHKVDGLKTALVRAFDEMKDVLITMEGKKGENTRKVINRPSGDKENIVVAGGRWVNSVEMFNWRQRTWSLLQSMPKVRYGATSFIYNNHMTIAGGYCGGSGIVDDMIRMNIDPNPDLWTHWSDCPVKLPDKLRCHSSVLYNDQLIISGGDNGNGSSDLIRAVQLVPPYTVKTLSRMPEPRQRHSMEIFDDNLLIVGGRTTGGCKDNLSSVVLYDIKRNGLKQLSPLPYEVSDMATVRWGDNIVVIGGEDKHGKALDTVIIYNVNTEQSHMLPSMRCKRRGCTAVVIENNIVVLGGFGERREVKSVEGFNFERYSWEELPEMSEARYWHTAVVV